MAQSSIHIDKVTTGSFLHNDRTMKPSYLIDQSAKNDCTVSSKIAFENFQGLKDQAEKNYIARTGQRMQKKTVFLKEAIINLEAHHTLEDLVPIIKKLNGYGFTILQTSIHRDEGFVSGQRSGKNYHAHITMFNLDPATGKTVKFGKDYRQELSRLQTITAHALNMERGGVSVMEEALDLKVPMSKAKRRLDTHEYKRAMNLKDHLEQEVINLRRSLAVAASVFDKSAIPPEAERAVEHARSRADPEQLEKLRTHPNWIKLPDMSYNFRETQKQISALQQLDTEQKKELHRLNTEINKIKKDDEAKLSKIKELEEKLATITETTLKPQNEIKAYMDQIDELKETVRTLENKIETISNERDHMDKLYGGLIGTIEEGADIEDVHKLIAVYKPYEPVRQTYTTAKERAKSAYKTKLGRSPILQPEPEKETPMTQKQIGNLFKKLSPYKATNGRGFKR